MRTQPNSINFHITSDFDRQFALSAHIPQISNAQKHKQSNANFNYKFVRTSFILFMMKNKFAPVVFVLLFVEGPFKILRVDQWHKKKPKEI